MPPVVEHKEAPSYAQTFEQILLQRDLSEQRYVIDCAFWQSVWTIIQDEVMTPEEKLALLRTTIAQMSAALLAWAQQFLAAMASTTSLESMAAFSHLALETKATALLFDFSTSAAAERKAGAVLSARNKALLESVILQLQALLASATPAESASANSHALDTKGTQAPATNDAPAPESLHADASADEDADAMMLQRLVATLSGKG